MSIDWSAIPRRARVATILVATLASTAIGATAGASAESARQSTITPKALASHDWMRALWEPHGTWTERANRRLSR